jgi:hypothetical protein
MFASEWGSALVTETRIVQPASGIGIGRAVSQGATPKEAILGGAAATFLGITLRDITLVAAATAIATPDLYLENQNIGIMNAGDIWVIAVNGCTAGAAATFDATTGQLNPAAAGIAIAHSRWLQTVTAGNLAVLRLTSANP